MGARSSAFCSGSVCGKANTQPITEHDIFDDSSTCDPAGAVFQDTLEDLSEVDRLLLTFVSSANLVAVRWLVLFGANVEACDSNGTTCLHAACRSGSLPVVRELIVQGLPLDATDASGWTALHVACFMGRRKVALELMLSGAELCPRNVKGFTPRALCSDEWLRSAITACAEHRMRSGSHAPWKFEREREVREDVQMVARLHFEPFFVPRAPVLQNLNTGSLVGVGVEIFMQRPGQGLAFLVATGCVRDYPVELSIFLAEHKLKTQVGEFLGEDFSLSQTLRLEFLNSVRLVGTGVVSALAKVFQNFQIPSDLHKLNRLLEGTAQIWWRQHEQARDAAHSLPVAEVDGENGDEGPEIGGLELMQILGDHDLLHQLMMSVIFLHWSLYAPLPPSRRTTRLQWVQINTGIAEADADAGFCSSAPSEELRRVLTRIYNVVSQCHFSQLQFWFNRGPGIIGRSSGAEGPTREPTMDPQVEDIRSADGWGLLVGCSLPAPAGTTSSSMSYRHIRSILSEATSTTLTLVSPATSRSSRPGGLEPQSTEVHSRTGSRVAACGGAPCHLGGSLSGACGVSPILEPWPEVTSPGCRGDQVWLSLRQGLLFLAPKPSNWAPYAFMDLRDVVVQDFDRGTLTVSLAMKKAEQKASSSPPKAGKLPEAGGGQADSSPAANKRPTSPRDLQLVFLLPDGRWQLLDVPILQVQLLDAEHMDHWRRELEVQCQIANLSTPPADTGGSADDPPRSTRRDL